MDEQTVYRRLTPIFGEAFGREIALRPDLTAREVRDWDSFKQVEIIIATERAFGFKFKSAEIDDLQHLGAFVGVILAKTGQG